MIIKIPEGLYRQIIKITTGRESERRKVELLFFACFNILINKRG